MPAFDVAAKIHDGINCRTLPYVRVRRGLPRIPTRDGQTACLLLDVHLPGMSGFDLHERLRRLGLSIPTVFMSGRDDSRLWELAQQAGAVACPFKPFDHKVLLAALRKATGEG